MRVAWYLSDLHACGTVRADVPARAIGQYFPGVSMALKREIMVSDYTLFDAMIFQRGCDANALGHMRTAKAQGIKVLYDLDDDLFNVPACVPDAHAAFSQEHVKDAIKAMLAEAHVVTVSCPAMVQVVEPHTKAPVLIVENCVDVGHADLAPMQPPREHPVMGWHGSMCHIADANLVSGPIKEVLDAHPGVKFQTFGNFVPEHFPELVGFNGRFACFPWTTPQGLYTALRGVDIGLCPQEPTRFNQVKSQSKWMEYAVLGIPTVVSPTRPYEMLKDGEDCLVAAGNAKGEWIRCLNALAGDKELRERIGHNARLRVLREYDNKIVAGHWVKALEFAMKET